LTYLIETVYWLALALSRLIDNSVVVLENIFRHLEEGEEPVVAAERGGQEVALPVLAGTLTTVVVFFPGTPLYGVSKFLFSALALAVVISLLASYFVALTVVPLFCARFIKTAHGDVDYKSAETEEMVKAEPSSHHHGLLARFAHAVLRAQAYLLNHSAEETAKSLPQSFQGSNHEAFIAGLNASRPMYSADGRFDPAAAKTVTGVLSVFYPKVKTDDSNLKDLLTNEYLPR